MAELKTQKNKVSVSAFIASVPDAQKRKDCQTVMKIMKEVTGNRPAMWGTSIVGYGSYHYKYASGREGDWPLVGFSPRKQNLVVYIMAGFSQYDALMKKLGQYKTGSSCLYIKRLDDIHKPTLKQLIRQSVAYMKKKYH